MPIFEFRCLECGGLFEKLFLTSNENVDIACPECGAGSFERVISRANHVMGATQGVQQPMVTNKSCSAWNQCTTFDLPGYTK